MHDYMTRRMIARIEMTYADWPLKPGDPFMATPVDSIYFTRTGRAVEAPPQAPASPPAAPAAPAKRAGVRRTPAAQQSVGETVSPPPASDDADGES